MKEANTNNYITLQQATEFCNYTQEYLSLRARQGKLKAVKFGRNWKTKREWLEEYIKKAEEYLVTLAKATRVPETVKLDGVSVLEKEAERVAEMIAELNGERGERGERGVVQPPENLPVSDELVFTPLIKVDYVPSPQKIKELSRVGVKLNPVLTLASALLGFVLALIITGIVVGIPVPDIRKEVLANISAILSDVSTRFTCFMQ